MKRATLFLALLCALCLVQPPTAAANLMSFSYLASAYTDGEDRWVREFTSPTSIGPTRLDNSVAFKFQAQDWFTLSHTDAWTEVDPFGFTPYPSSTITTSLWFSDASRDSPYGLPVLPDPVFSADYEVTGTGRRGTTLDKRIEPGEYWISYRKSTPGWVTMSDPQLYGSQLAAADHLGAVHVPEPATMAMMAAGLGFIPLFRKKLS